MWFLQVSASGQNVWGVDSKDRVFYRKGLSGMWTGIDGARLKQVAWRCMLCWLAHAAEVRLLLQVSASGQNVWGVDSKDHVFYRKGLSGTWTEIDGARLKQVAWRCMLMLCWHMQLRCEPSCRCLLPDKTCGE